jgi:hypothetical protein
MRDLRRRRQVHHLRLRLHHLRQRLHHLPRHLRPMLTHAHALRARLHRLRSRAHHRSHFFGREYELDSVFVIHGARMLSKVRSCASSK